MLKFNYTVVDQQGEMLNGIIEANNIADAKNNLLNLGYKIISLGENENKQIFIFNAINKAGKEIKGIIKSFDLESAKKVLEDKYEFQIISITKENKEDLLKYENLIIKGEKLLQNLDEEDLDYQIIKKEISLYKNLFKENNIGEFEFNHLNDLIDEKEKELNHDNYIMNLNKNFNSKSENDSLLSSCITSEINNELFFLFYYLLCFYSLFIILGEVAIQKNITILSFNTFAINILSNVLFYKIVLSLILLFLFIAMVKYYFKNITFKLYIIIIFIILIINFLLIKF